MRVVNVVDLMTLQPPREHPHGLTDEAFDALFPPGTRFSYSNTNYIAVGAVLERVTGKCVADLVRDRIVRPLGLQHT